jgi:hypothetical protein
MTTLALANSRKGWWQFMTSKLEGYRRDTLADELSPGELAILDRIENRSFTDSTRDPIAPSSLPRIPEGEYEAIGMKCEKRTYLGGREKLYLYMEIQTDSKIQEKVILTRYYNWYDKPGPRSDFYVEYVKANDCKAPRGRMSPSIFVGKRFLVKVSDVTRDRDGDELTGDLISSKIKKILKRLPD